MKKQLLTIAMVTMLLVATLISTVSASTVGASAATVKAGEKVTVKVTTDSKLDAAKVRLTFDSSKYSITEDDVTVNGKATKVVTVKEGEVVVTLFDAATELTTNEVTFNFTAKTDAKAGETSFELTEFSGSKTESLDTFKAGKTAKVTVVAEEKPTPTPDQKPTNKPTQKPTSKPTQKPDTLSQTGAPLYVVGIAFVVVAAFVLMVRKAK